MSMALVELTQRRSLVGTSHLATSLLITALLGFGIDVGDAVADGVGLRTQAGASPSGACSHPVPPPAQWAALLPTSAALCVQMGATLRQAPWLVGVAYACIAASQGLRARPAARKLSTLVGALVAGWLANAHANATGKPALAAAAMGVRWRVTRGVTQHASNCLQSINLACASLQVMILIPDGLANLSGLGLGGGLFGLYSAIQLMASVAQASVAIAAGLFVATLLLRPVGVKVVARGAARAPAQPRGWWRGALRHWVTQGRWRVRGAYARSRAAVMYF